MLERVKLLGDRVLVKQAKKEDEKRGDIIIPGTVGKEKLEGLVVATGPGLRTADGKGRLLMDVAPGDYVLFVPQKRESVTIDGEEYLMMGVDKVLCVLEKEPEGARPYPLE